MIEINYDKIEKIIGQLPDKADKVIVELGYGSSGISEDVDNKIDIIMNEYFERVFRLEGDVSGNKVISSIKRAVHNGRPIIYREQKDGDNSYENILGYQTSNRYRARDGHISVKAKPIIDEKNKGEIRKSFGWRTDFEPGLPYPRGCGIQCEYENVKSSQVLQLFKNMKELPFRGNESETPRIEEASWTIYGKRDKQGNATITIMPDKVKIVYNGWREDKELPEALRNILSEVGSREILKIEMAVRLS